MIENRIDVLEVAGAVLAPDREGGDAVMGGERRGDRVLGRQRVAGAEPDVGAAGSQRDGEIGRLAGDVEAGSEPEAGERPLPFERSRMRPSTGISRAAQAISRSPSSARERSATSYAEVPVLLVMPSPGEG
jgi:hypothetical protein